MQRKKSPIRSYTKKSYKQGYESTDYKISDSKSKMIDMEVLNDHRYFDKYNNLRTNTANPVAKFP